MTRATETQADREAFAAPARVLTVSLRRVRRGRAVAFDPVEPEPAPPKRSAHRAAQMLALAHEFQRLIDTGELPDRAALAAQVGLTRARITQIMDLLLLAPDIQEAVLAADVESATLPPSERHLRAVVSERNWEDQRRTAPALPG